MDIERQRISQNEVQKWEHRVTQPWSGFQLVDGEHAIFAPQIRPLTRIELEGITRSVVDDSGDYSQSIRDANSNILARHDNIAVVLDGRSSTASEGFLGDMIEATRIVNPLLSTGKKITIVTPHEDAFMGSDDVEVLPIPKKISGSPRYPWNEQLREFIYTHLGDTPTAFPLNAALATFVQFKEHGEFANTQVFSKIREAVRPGSEKPTIKELAWWRRELHQLQALQTMMYLMGIPDVDAWTKFPEAYLFPSPLAQQTATNLIARYDCFNGNEKSNRIPLFIHPGVATGGIKLVSKYYPEKNWRQVINLLAERNRIRSVVFLRPSNEEQAIMAENLAAFAISKGFFTSLIPPRGEQSATEWTFGTFNAFLQELSKSHGLVLGVDSMPAGHAATATGNHSVVLASLKYNPSFYSPEKNARVIIPKNGEYTSSISPEQVTNAVEDIVKEVRS